MATTELEVGDYVKFQCFEDDVKAVASNNLVEPVPYTVGRISKVILTNNKARLHVIEYPSDDNGPLHDIIGEKWLTKITEQEAMLWILSN